MCSYQNFYKLGVLTCSMVTSITFALQRLGLKTLSIKDASREMR